MFCMFCVVCFVCCTVAHLLYMLYVVLYCSTSVIYVLCCVVHVLCCIGADVSHGVSVLHVSRYQLFCWRFIVAYQKAMLWLRHVLRLRLTPVKHRHCIVSVFQYMYCMSYCIACIECIVAHVLCCIVAHVSYVLHVVSVLPVILDVYPMWCLHAVLAVLYCAGAVWCMHRVWWLFHAIQCRRTPWRVFDRSETSSKHVTKSQHSFPLW